MANIGSKLKEYFDSKGITQVNIASQLGVSKSYVNALFTGKREFGKQQAENWSNLFGLSSSWLLTGDGEMLKKDSTIEVSPVIEKSGEYLTENTNGVKFYDIGNGKYRIVVKKVPYSAYGRFINEADTLEPDKEGWKEESFESDQIVHGKYLAFDVKGESMDDGTRNSFEEGDVILVRELGKQHWHDPIRFKERPYWVIVSGTSVLLKQMIAQNMRTGDLTFHSLNSSPEYSDFTLNVNEIRALYYVLQKKPKTVKF